MAAVLTKSETSTDSKGRSITTETWEAFDGPPSAPSGASNVKRTHTDGKHTLVFDNTQTDSTGEEYSVEGSMSQEPIETHEKFKSISAADWKKWNLWKNNPNDENLNGWKPGEQSGPISPRSTTKG